MKKDTKLDPRQIRILEDYFLRSVAGETMDAIAEANGISRKTLWTWKETDEGKRRHAEFQKELSVKDIPNFYRSLSEGVAKGDFKKMELFAKIHGMLAPEKKEIISKNENYDIVKDGVSPELLGELDALLKGSGGKPTIKRVK